jgi:hypothetical protein
MHCLRMRACVMRPFMHSTRGDLCLSMHPCVTGVSCCACLSMSEAVAVHNLANNRLSSYKTGTISGHSASRAHRGGPCCLPLLHTKQLQPRAWRGYGSASSHMWMTMPRLHNVVHMRAAAGPSVQYSSYRMPQMAHSISL